MNWVIMPFIENYPDTQQAVADVLAQTVPDLRLLLIDQGSRDAAASWALTKSDPRILYWRFNPALLSLATVWNTALQTVWAAGGTHALVVNNDVRLPKRLYHDLLEAQRQTLGWFITASNVRDAWYPGMMNQSLAITPEFLESRGGPDFSCFLINQEVHRYFQFDEAFRPAYFEDNDYHRRLQLAGWGHQIFSVNIPYLHYGSGTLRNVERLTQGWNERFAACRQYYIDKWGGIPGQETHQTPFGVTPAFASWMVTGQGKPGHTFQGELPWGSLTT